MFPFVALAIAGAGGALGVAVKKYREVKDKHDMPWSHGAKQLAKKNQRVESTSLAWTDKGKETVKKLQEGKLAVPSFVRTGFFSDARLEQQLELSSLADTSPNEISEVEQEVNRYLAISSISLALASAGTLFYPPLTFLSAVGIAYGSLPILRDAYNSLVQEKKFGIAGLASIAAITLLVGGYYFAASLGYTLYFLSEKLLIRTQDHSKKGMISIFFEQPRFVWVRKDGIELELPFEELKVDDIVVVNAGELIPIDGTITTGYASIDQRMLTGESQPAEKGVGDAVFASTIMLSGKIQIQVEKAGQDTVAAQIGHILNNTLDFKSSVELKGQEIADKSALPTVALALLALPVAGKVAALTILNACAGETIRLVAPIGLLNFLQMASDQGILIKDGRALELLNDVDTVVFDKTGTLTEEQPHVGAIHTCHGINENELLTLAAAAEYKQTHPIARAIQQEALQRELDLPKIEDATYEIGYGLNVVIEQKVVLVGSKRFMLMSEVAIPPEIDAIQQQCNEHGYSLVYVALDGQLAGAIELHATIRPEAKGIISELRQRGLEIYIISGDHEKPTKKLAQELDIEHYFAETLPENKAKLIEQLQNSGKAVCFVGDGINDSIALKTANVSVSLRGASTIATDTAQVILMDGNLKSLMNLFDIATDMQQNMKGNLAATIIPSVVTIGGAFFLHFGVLSAIWLYNVGLLAGVANAMRPMITYKRDTQNKVLGKSETAEPAIDQA